MGLTALLLGFAGSFHCALMCSPLVAAVGGVSWTERLTYHVGRISTYSIVGGLLAIAGSLTLMPSLQRGVTIGVGVLLVMAGLGRVIPTSVPVITPILARLNVLLKNRFSALLHRKNLGSRFGLGVLNGLLPCGLTVLGLAYCLGLAGFADGFQFMALFGIGTLPALVVGPWIGARLAHGLRVAPSAVNNFLLFFLGTVMIIRGGWMAAEIRGLPSAAQIGETISWCIP